MNRIQSKDHRTRTYEINKISFSCFDEKTKVFKYKHWHNNKKSRNAKFPS